MTNPASAREIALAILYRVSEEGAYANIELNRVLSGKPLSQQDRGLVTELVYGTLRLQGRIDYILSQFVKKPLAGIHRKILIILRMAVYQIFQMDRIPDRAAVNEAVNLAKKYGHPGTVRFVNGVLRNMIRGREAIRFPSPEDPAAYLSVFYSHPRWLVEKWLREMGPEETEKLCAADNEAAAVTIRTNTLKITRDSLMEQLKKEGVSASLGRFAPESLTLESFPSIASLPSYGEGLFQVQDEGSMLAAMALGALPGERVVDACAAPGGKTTYLAQSMENRGEIKAFDIYPHKLALVEDNCRRLGVSIVKTSPGDARELPVHLDGWADRVLVDAPCSGLGVLRRRPDARWQKDPAVIEELSSLQKAILERAARTLRPGGVLVYSTCTVSPEENTGVVEDFLQNNPEFFSDPIDKFFALPLAPEDQEQAKRGMIQFLPHRHGTDGMFIARMRRGEAK